MNKASDRQADSALLNAIFLVLWMILCGKLAGSHFMKDRPRVAFISSFHLASNVQNIKISRIAATAQAAGFFIIGIWPLYPAMMAGRSEKTNMTPRNGLTFSNNRSRTLRTGTAISYSDSMCFDVHDSPPWK